MPGVGTLSRAQRDMQILLLHACDQPFDAGLVEVQRLLDQGACADRAADSEDDEEADDEEDEENEQENEQEDEAEDEEEDEEQEIWGTPLYRAAGSGSKAVCQCLIRRGARVDKLYGGLFTPLNTACEKGHLEIAQLLLDEGADVNLGGEVVATPLIKAVSEGHVDVVELLLSRGADIHLAYHSGDTPMHMACMHGDPKVAALLLSSGASIHQPCPWSMHTPLHIACKGGHLQLAELLLSLGADTTAVDRSGCTPLFAAARKRHREVSQLLLRRGAELGQPIHLPDGIDTRYDFLSTELYNAVANSNVTEQQRRHELPACERSAAESFMEEIRAELLAEAGPAAQHQPSAKSCAQCGAGAQCSTTKLYKCSHCRTVYYCSSECQAVHWRQGGHKQRCKELHSPEPTAAAGPSASA